MHTVYPVINGKEVEHKFYENWEETPLTAFVSWQNLVPELKEHEQHVEEQNKVIINWSKKYEELFFRGRKGAANNYLKKIKNRQKKVDKLNEELHRIEVSAISNFTTIPMIDLLGMKRALTEDEQITDSYIDRYKLRLVYLAMQELPTGSMSSFYFQSKTDEEIEELEKQYSNTTVFSFKERRRLAHEIEAAKRQEYKVKDIWEQTTTLNRELQDTANDIVEEMKNGNYESLPYLIALLTLEDNAGSEKLNEIKDGDANSYLEVYMKEVKEILQQRMKIFYDQKEKLSVAHAIQIKNFFLSRLTNL